MIEVLKTIIGMIGGIFIADMMACGLMTASIKDGFFRIHLLAVIPVFSTPVLNIVEIKKLTFCQTINPLGGQTLHLAFGVIGPLFTKVEFKDPVILRRGFHVGCYERVVFNSLNGNGLIKAFKKHQ